MSLLVVSPGGAKCVNLKVHLHLQGGQGKGLKRVNPKLTGLPEWVGPVQLGQQSRSSGTEGVWVTQGAATQGV